MTQSIQRISPLRQRMLDDMRMRKTLTQDADRLRARREAVHRYLKRSPDTATAEDLRRFQLDAVDQGMSAITLNATITGLKFFFDTTLGHPELMAKMQYVPVQRRLPVVLSVDEAARLIAAAGSLKYRAAFSVAYGAGLRASEVVGLRVADVDSQRMILPG